MKRLRKESVASVAPVEAVVSEDELAVCESALSYALGELSDADIERRLGATRDEVEAIREDLREALRARDEVRPLAGVSEKS
ncbi:MAG TPA: hypothetical protein VG148_15280 [Pyrinomonadaceae bacterium]|nr:hypothetical protein [Pyrinomonadaceae bacterium]